MSDLIRLQEAVDDGTARIKEIAKALDGLAAQQCLLLERLESPTFRADLGRASEYLGVVALGLDGQERNAVLELARRLRKEATR